ncbi:MAG: hypothetical protein NVSMB40_17520 [Aquirhabdus sp.]
MLYMTYAYAIFTLPATWLIFYLGKQEKHGMVNGESIFRFPKAFLIGVLLFSLFALGFEVAFVISFLKPVPFFFCIIISLATLLPLWLLYAMARFYFAIGSDSINWRRFNTVKSLTFERIKLIKIEDGWRSGVAFGVPAGRGSKVAIRIYDTNGLAVNLACYLQDIEALQRQLLSRAHLHHVAIEGSDEYPSQLITAKSSQTVVESYQDKSTKEIRWSRVFLILAIFIPMISYLGHLGNASSRKYHETKAIQIMQEECARNCATYGVTQTNLIGPTLESEWSTRGGGEYLYSWHSTDPNVTLKVDMKWQSGSEEQITPQWSNIAPNRDKLDMGLKLGHYEAAIHEIQSTIPPSTTSSPRNVIIDFQIAPNGHVINAAVTHSDLNNPNIEKQFLKIFEGINFGAGNFAPMNYEYTIQTN